MLNSVRRERGVVEGIRWPTRICLQILSSFACKLLRLEIRCRGDHYLRSFEFSTFRLFEFSILGVVQYGNQEPIKAKVGSSVASLRRAALMLKAQASVHVDVLGTTDPIALPHARFTRRTSCL